jgi:cytochrome P450
MSAAITARDARYEELFQVENEAHGLGMHLIEDPYPAFRRMLATGAVLKGNLAECMGHPADWAGLFTMRDRPTYTAVSFDAVNEAFMDNETYSSEIYMALGVHVRLGDTILNMVGEKHRRYRILIQKEFQPSVAGSWWNDKFIRDAVDELVAAIET